MNEPLVLLCDGRATGRATAVGAGAHPWCRAGRRCRLPMAYPGAQLLEITKYRVEPTELELIPHYRLMREFF